MPASNVGGLVIHWSGLKRLDSTYLAMTRNNLCIISISLETPIDLLFESGYIILILKCESPVLT